jgi:hypothetical protein
MARKDQKTNCYNLSESADFRFASTVSKKNKVKNYSDKVFKRLDLNSGKYYLKHVQHYKQLPEKRNLKTNTPTFKLKR